ncbi:MAG: exodeoxyribonuclease VII large subunit [Gammaproteobacteria bacterium]|nr:exodeoxyribonuclease VII large subunit [Gammaproteobacteria bacterium]
MAKRGIPFGKRPPGPGGAEWGKPAGPERDEPWHSDLQGQGHPPRPEPRPSNRPPIHSVRQAIELANRALERAFPSMWIEGEVSNLVLPRSGHAYFTLKDASAALPTAMWATSVRRLRFRLEEGQRLRVFGRMAIYAAQGRFQLYADRAEPAGLGELTLQLEQLKRRLAGEGLFAADRKRPLPPWPKLVGVVTSPSGAAIHDILEVVRRRMPTPILLAPAKVQGPEAPFELIAALRRLARVEAVEVIILGRGGGSMEDLWAFNHEGLARAVAECPKPVVSAVGHEVDVTIAELVADRRAATPSAAAEIAVPEEADSRRQLSLLRERLGRQVERRLRDARRTIEATRAKLAAPQRLIDRRRLLIDELSQRSERSLNQRLRAAREVLASAMLRLERQRPQTQLLRSAERISGLHQRLVATMHGRLGENRSHLGYLAGRLNALSPLAVLERGYSVTRNLRGEVLVEANAANLGEMLLIDLFRGRLQVRVEQQLDAESSPRPAGLDEGKSH